MVTRRSHNSRHSESKAWNPGELVVHYVTAVCDVHQSSAIRRLPYMHASPTAHPSRTCNDDKKN